jgi:hypothetical protein
MKSRLSVAIVVFCIIQYLGNIGPLPRLVCAQVARIEIHSLKTMTLTDEQFLTGVKEGKQDVIGGELRIPRPGKDRLVLADY